VPLPWSGAEPPFGFEPAGAVAEPWLPQPKDWRDLTVAAQTGAPGSMLELYRAALSIRKSEPALGDGPMSWLPSAPGVLAFVRGTGVRGTGVRGTGVRGTGVRGTGVRCVVNISAGPVVLPAHDGVLLASGPLDGGQPGGGQPGGGMLPPDTTVWLRMPRPSR
jgi:alpha-glucosidase